MRRTPALFVVALAGALATGSVITAERVAEEVPTFSKDVARRRLGDHHADRREKADHVLCTLPHMHLRGKDMRFMVVWPDGREEMLLDVPRYDFNWQTEFEFVEPLQIPGGSRLIVLGHYDSSLNNRYNPAPDKEVYWGEQSWDEMFEGWINYSIDSQDLTKEPATQD